MQFAILHQTNKAAAALFLAPIKKEKAPSLNEKPPLRLISEILLQPYLREREG
jgi:hypothetical protein